MKTNRFIELFDIRKVFVNHFDTFKYPGKSKFNSGIYSFFILPAIVSAALIFFKICLSESYVSLITTVLSIFIGLFFNVILIIFDLIQRANSDENDKSFFKELLYNILFLILSSVITIVLSFLGLIERFQFKFIFGFLTYFSLGHIILTVFLILKRVSDVFEKESSEENVKSEY